VATVQRSHSFFRPRLEQLEPRLTPSADLFTNMVGEMLEAAPDLVPAVPYYLQHLRSDGSFSDLNYRGNSNASATDLTQVGIRLEAMSVAYKWSDPGNSYFNSTALKTQILQGWSYLASKGGQVTAPNWWWKAIGVPQSLADGLVLMKGEMAANVRSQILTKYFSADWQPTKMDGANLAYQAPPALIDGFLRGDSSRITSVVSAVSRELSAYSGEGINRDLSFFQHKGGSKYIDYSGAYGMVWVKDVSRVMRWVGDTPYAFGVTAVDQQVHFVLDGQQWLTRGDAFDIPSQGRSITRPGWPTMEPYMLRNAMADLVPLGRRTDELLAGIDRYDNGVSDTNYLSGNKSFWMADAMANQRENMLTTVKMISNRVARPETAAGENTKGFFEGDGFTMFVQDGDEFGSRGGPDIMAVWDWQRLPGTTVEHNGKIPNLDMFKTGTNAVGGSDIVGSASDGQYGVAAMDYRRSGVTVTAKKAWFFFDNEVVALGAGISDPGGLAPVYTSLNQVLLDSSVTMKDAGGRQTFDLGGSATLHGQGWIVQDGLGYVLLDPSDTTTVQAQLQTGASGPLPVFSAWIDHGKAPKAATYAYAVVPGVTPDTLDAYSQSLPITILSNTSTVQAVQNASLHQTQAAFYAAGSVQIAPGLTVSVNQPINLIIKQVGSDLVITGADPRQTATSATITITQQLSGPGVKLLADGHSSQITFALPGIPYRGSSLTQTYHLLSPAPNGAEGEAPLHNAISTSPVPPTQPVLSSLLGSSVLSSVRTVSSVSASSRVGQVSTNRLTPGHSGTVDASALDALMLDPLDVWDDSPAP
jgi:chondroitin AC lyase